MADEKKSKLWLIFIAAVLIQFAAWTAWFIIAAHHPVRDINEVKHIHP
jgi:hypothetical protein